VGDAPTINYNAVDDFLAKEAKTEEGPLCVALSEMTKLKPHSHDNSILDTITSGSKGSIINYNQIASTVGQQNTDKGRLSHQFHRRLLPHFNKGDTSIEARGYVKNAFTKGFSPAEFFMHSVAGRVGLISTSIKTAETGWVQRKLTKTLETLLAFDVGQGRRMVKNVGTVIQFNYGHDGYDVTFLCQF